MDAKNLGDSPAYPTTRIDQVGKINGIPQLSEVKWPGLTIRQRFAMAAMQGLCSDRDEAGILVEKGHAWIADQAVKCADALIYELCHGVNLKAAEDRLFGPKS